MQKKHFAAEGPLFLRASSFRREAIEALLDASPTGAADTAELVRYIRSLAGDPGFRSAIAVASVSLVRTWDQVLAGEDLSRKRLMKVAISLTKYALRMRGRPTPFGLHAGVAGLDVGPATAVTERAEKFRVHLDEEWFAEVKGPLLDDPALRRETAVTWNNLGYTRGDRLVVPNAQQVGEGDRGWAGRASLRRTPLLEHVRDLTRQPRVYARLVEALTAFVPHVTEAQADGYLRQLIEVGALSTTLTSDGWEGLPDVNGPAAAVLATLRTVREKARAIEAGSDPGRVEEDVRAAAEAARALGGSNRTPLQVDLALGVRATLPQAVLTEVENYASAMWQIVPQRPSHPHMAAYFLAFIDRYGQQATVPLEELIDSHRGLGFPMGYVNPPVSSREFPEAPGTGDEAEAGNRMRAETLAALLHRGLLDGDTEVTLTADDLDALAVPSPEGSVPSSMDLCFQLVARGASALDQGDFTLVGSPMVGARVIGATAGRFADLLGCTDELRRVYEPSAGAPDTVHAQLLFRPTTPRALNVMRAPVLSPHTLPIGVAPASEGTTLDWRELVVHCDGTGLRLYWPRGEKYVQPFVPHMLALQGRAPNLVRFLSELRYTRGTPAWREWAWEGYEALPVLPRVRVGKVVAHPKTWTPSRFLKAEARRPQDWDQSVKRWRTESRVDRHVNIVNQDRVYAVDLDRAFHREILRRELLKSNVKITEDPARDPQAFGWLQDRPNEIVIALRSPEPQPPTRVLPPPQFATPAPAASAPPALAGAWTYAQIYVDLDYQNEFVRTHLPALVRSTSDLADQWFFVRFNAPEPHIRLRLRTSSPAAREQLRTRLSSALDELGAAGIVRHSVLSGYAPETARYGGQAALPLAEAVFCVDSQVAVNQVNLLESGRLRGIDTRTLMVAGYASLLEGLGIDWSGWAADRFKRSDDGSVTRRHVEAACRVIAPSDTATSFSEHLPEANLARAWAEGDAARRYGWYLREGTPGLSLVQQDYAVSSLLHMQHNRLIGADREHERATLTLLGHVARHWARR
ncbi:lantibiotic dehydratase [Streptomyces bacillaris]|uniref:lantibiotic dehydratase n=1 Tax=Streptomyces bacillaris TaxID=68179 RepID=UPI00369A2083